MLRNTDLYMFHHHHHATIINWKYSRIRNKLRNKINIIKPIIIIEENENLQHFNLLLDGTAKQQTKEKQ